MISTQGIDNKSLSSLTHSYLDNQKRSDYIVWNNEIKSISSLLSRLVIQTVPSICCWNELKSSSKRLLPLVGSPKMLGVSNIATAMGQQLVDSPTLIVSGVAVKTGYCTKKLHLVGF